MNSIMIRLLKKNIPIVQTVKNTTIALWSTAFEKFWVPDYVHTPAEQIRGRACFQVFRVF